ncbi:hypothetical protein Tsubulata_046704, partial [Turnera subulata]
STRRRSSSQGLQERDDEDDEADEEEEDGQNEDEDEAEEEEEEGLASEMRELERLLGRGEDPAAREAARSERRKIQELKTKSASSKGQPCLLQFGSSTFEILETAFKNETGMKTLGLGLNFEFGFWVVAHAGVEDERRREVGVV